MPILEMENVRYHAADRVGKTKSQYCDQCDFGDPLCQDLPPALSHVTGIDFPAETQECVFEIAGIFDILKEQRIDQYTGPILPIIRFQIGNHLNVGTVIGNTGGF